MSAVGVAIMAHPDRAKSVERLEKRIGGDVQVIFDQEGPPTADTERRWRMGASCWEAAAAAGRPWSLVIQDDAVVCKDFRVGLDAALAVLPGQAVVSPYLGVARGPSSQERMDEAVARAGGSHWAWTRFLHWGVAVVLPTALVPDMLNFCSTPDWRAQNYDYRIARFVQDRLRQRVWCLTPSLVDHRDDGSLIGHGVDSKGHPYARRAHTFIGERKSALSFDWTTAPAGGFLLDLPSLERAPRPYREGAALIR